jgi:hypothetical protein
MARVLDFWKKLPVKIWLSEAKPDVSLAGRSDFGMELSILF